MRHHCHDSRDEEGLFKDNFSAESKPKRLLAQFWAFFDLRPAGGFDDAAKTFRNAKSGDQPGNLKGMQSEKGPGHSRT